jgi:hypothetical protein
MVLANSFYPHPRPFPRQQGKGEKSLSVDGEGFREGFQSLILSSPTVALCVELVSQCSTCNAFELEVFLSNPFFCEAIIPFHTNCG